MAEKIKVKEKERKEVMRGISLHNIYSVDLPVWHVSLSSTVEKQGTSFYMTLFHYVFVMTFD